MSQPDRGRLLTVKQVKAALKQWHNGDRPETPLSALYLFRKMMRETQKTARHVTNQLLLQGIEALQQVDEIGARLLQLRFLDERRVNYIAKQLVCSESVFYVKQRKALDALTTIIIELDLAARTAHQVMLYQRLEAPTYGELVGVEKHVEELFQQLKRPQAPWLMALEGLGGIGKTSLAHQTARQMIEHGIYDEIGWVSARRERLTLGGTVALVNQPVLSAEQLVALLAHQLLPELALIHRNHPSALLSALRQRLKQFPHLLIIDNLETVVDLEALLPTLQDLANPSKFLLTSREALYGAPNLYHFRVPELSEVDALALVRREIAISNSTALVDGTDDELRPIVATVGGNPLALRLVVGQTHIYTLHSILRYLREVRGQTAENLYTFIYRHAWESLDPASQDVLLIMPLVNPSGVRAELIAEVGALPLDVVLNALNRLIILSLVDVRSSKNEHGYSIHGLTRTFLHAQLLHHHAARFKTFLARSLGIARQQVAAEERDAPLAADVRAWAWNVLRYALTESAVWPATRDLLLTMAPKMEMDGYRADWLHYLVEGLNRSKAWEDERAAAELQFHCGYLYRLMSDYAQAAPLLEASAQLCSTFGDWQGQARALNQLAYLAWQQHDYNQAETVAKAALALVDDRSLEKAVSLSALGLVANDSGRHAEAAQHHEAALLIRTQHGAKKEMARSLQNIGIALREQGKVTAAVDHYQQALTLLDQVYDPAHRAIIQMNLSTCYYIQGEHDQALTIMADAEQGLAQFADQLNLAKLLTIKGLCYLAQNQAHQAEEPFRTSAAIFHQLGDFSWYLNAYDGLGITYLEQEQYEQALAIFTEIADQLPTIVGTPAHRYLAATVPGQIAQAQAQQVKRGDSVYYANKK